MQQLRQPGARLRYASALLVSASAAVLLFGEGAWAQTAAPAAPLPEASAAAPDAAAVEAVVVTGSRLQTGFQAPTPVTVVGSDRVNQQAPATIGEVINQIPAFRNSSGTQTSNFGIVASSQNLLDLRGLGASRTLVLIDGQRHVPVNSGATFDTNQLPTSLIDHFDVVTGGASAAYGSDAVAGVVNFVMKDHLQGVTGNVQYGLDQHGGDNQPVLSLAAGTAFDGGKGHFVIGGDWSKNNGVYNMYKRDWGALEPGALTLPTTRAAGLPANIIANNIEFDSLTPGGLIPSGPLKGTAFGAGGAIYQLQYGALAGTNEMINNDNYGAVEYRTQELGNPYKRAAALARAEYDFSDHLSGFVMGSWGMLHTSTDSLFQPTPGSAANWTILSSNPYIPAALAAAMTANKLSSITLARYNYEQHSLQSNNQQDTMQLNAGLKGDLGGGWKWDVDGTAGKTESRIELDNTPRTADYAEAAYAVKDASGNIVCGPPATNPAFQGANSYLIAQVDPGCVPLNPFLGPGTLNPASIAYYNSASEQHLEIKQTTVEANLTGEPFMLPAGPLSLAIGADYRKDSVTAIGCPDCVAKKLVNQDYPSYSAAVNTKEAYGEIGVPIVKDVTLFKSLDLNAAVRHVDYSTSGTVNTWKLGGTWDVNDMLRFRLTRSRDIRAPNIAELFDPGSNGKGNVTNKLTGGSGLVDSRTTGNPNLLPEVANTLTYGAVFQPTWDFAKGFRASVDYFDIELANVVGSVAQQDVLDRCLLQKLQEYCAFTTPDAGNPTGFSGVYSTRINLANQQAQGFDFEGDYRVPLPVPGRFDIRALATYTRHQNVTQVVNGVSTTTEVAGSVASSGGVAGVPKWQWNVNFNYALDRFQIGMTMHTTSSVKYSVTLVGPDDPTYSPSLANSVNRNIWPGIAYFAMNTSYNLIDSGGKRLQLYLNVDNLMDKNPPVVAISIFGGNPYDLVGRRFKAGLRFNY